MQMAEKLSITLPAEMVRTIRAKVSGGGYGSNSEVIREAMRGWMERERSLVALDLAIARGIADADAGRTKSVEDVRAAMRARRNQAAAKAE
jgi:antitoxin ParD1/3/4